MGSSDELASADAVSEHAGNGKEEKDSNSAASTPANEDSSKEKKCAATTSLELAPDADVEQGQRQHVSLFRRNWSRRGLYTAWFGIILMSTVISLDQQTVYSYQPYATSEFSAASLLGTIGTIQNILYAVAKPPIAKIADVFGRFEAFATGVLLVTLGFIMLATSQNLATYAAAQIFFVAGQITLQFMIQVYAADTSNLQNRAILNALPYFPFLVTTWVGGHIVEAVITHSTWRWGYGMYSILLPAGSIPLLATLWCRRKAPRPSSSFSSSTTSPAPSPSSPSPSSPSPSPSPSSASPPPPASPSPSHTHRPQNPWQVFRQLDVIGLVVLTAGLTLLLLPMTLAASSPDSWRSARIIVMLVLGVVLLAAFVAWERWGARYPMLSFHLLRDRTVLGACGASAFEYIAFYIYQPYLYSYLVVTRHQSVLAATNIGLVYSFATTLSQLACALLVRRLGRFKPVVVAGVAVKCVAGGLMLRFRAADAPLALLVLSQVLLGGGMGAVNAVQVGVQAVAPVEDMASVTALLLTVMSAAGAVGDAIAGGLWTNLLPARLSSHLPPTSTSPTSPTSPTTSPSPSSSHTSTIMAIANSVPLALSYAAGTPERAAIDQSYDDVMRTMMLVNLVVLCAAVFGALAMRNVDLRVEDGRRAHVYEAGAVFGGAGAPCAGEKSEEDERREEERRD